jgi:hypothetical protein
MPCLIEDKLYAYGNDLTPQPLGNQQIFAVPTANTVRILVAGKYRILSVNPNITTAAFNEGIVATTDASGQFSFSIPYGATETKPINPDATWSLVFPDGKVLTGEVPTVAGPLLIDDLITTYNWAWTQGVVYTPPASGVEARGSAVFTAMTSVSVVFLIPMVSAAYEITLGISEDSTSPGFAPNYFWSNKTTTGFTINTSVTFTGFVDWNAKL